MNTNTMPDTARQILIAEDSATQAQRLQHILEQHGYRVTAAANGRLALEAAQHLQRRNDAVAGGVTIQAQNMAGAFAAEQPVAPQQLLEDIAIADFGAHVITASSPEYPAPLRTIHNPPVVLYVWGEVRAADAAGNVGRKSVTIRAVHPPRGEAATPSGWVFTQARPPRGR